MKESLEQKAELLFNRAKDCILQLVNERKRGYLNIRKPLNLCYKTSECGYICDDIGRITRNEEVIFLCEGKKCGSKYDVETDEDGIVSAHMYLDDLTLFSMCELADKLCNTNEFNKQYSDFVRQTEAVLSSITEPVCINPTPIEIDCNCHWFHPNAVRIYADGFADDNDRRYPFCDYECMSFIDDVQLAILADAVANSMQSNK